MSRTWNACCVIVVLCAGLLAPHAISALGTPGLAQALQTVIDNGLIAGVAPEELPATPDAWTWYVSDTSHTPGQRAAPQTWGNGYRVSESRIASKLLIRLHWEDARWVGGAIEILERSGNPRTRTEFLSSGDVSARESFRYRADGSLRSVERCVEAGCVLVAFSAQDAAVAAASGSFERIWGDDLRMDIQSDSRQRPSYVRTQRGDSTVEEWFTYANGALVERVRDDGRTRAVEELDSNQEPVSREVRAAGRLVETTRWERDVEGRALVRRTAYRSSVEEERWTWDGGTLLHREVLRDGALELTERHIGVPAGHRENLSPADSEALDSASAYDLVRTYFRDGQATTREYVRDQIVVDREVLR